MEVGAGDEQCGHGCPLLMAVLAAPYIRNRASIGRDSVATQ